MPKKNVGLFAVILTAIIGVRDANAYTSYICNEIGSCSTYYVAGGFSTTVSSVPDVYSYAEGCAQAVWVRTSADSTSLNTSSGGCVLIPTCLSCDDGYELTDSALPILFNNSNSACTSVNSQYDIKYCAKKSDSGDSGSTTTCTSSNCTSSGWSAHSTGYLVQTFRECVNDQCVETVRYGCAQGYFGSDDGINPYLSSAYGCVKCPGYYVSGNSYATTTNTTLVPTVAGCYVVATGDETEFSDGTGTYVFTPYSNLTEYCYYDFGSCTGVTPACTTSSGTAFAVVSGTKAHDETGTHCWCNVNGKSFYFSSQSTASACAANCDDMCSNAVFGFGANGGQPMVSLDDLGCY